MFRKTPWTKRDGGPAGAVKPGLPEERKALVERYMIDAKEAESRARRAAEELPARREAEEQARRAAEEQDRLVAEEQARREAEEQARRASEEQTRREAAEQLTRQAAIESETRRREVEERARQVAISPAEEAAEWIPHATIEPQATPEVEDPPATAAPDTDPAEPAAQRASEEFPIYVWLQRAAPTPGAAADWPRSLVKAKEEAGRGETPRV